jgi:hypothetical protein
MVNGQELERRLRQANPGFRVNRAWSSSSASGEKASADPWDEGLWKSQQ